MSILIKGVEMPKPGQIVLVEICENGDVFAAYDGGRTKLSQYQAVPVPPHGRLIDADELHKLFIKKGKEFKGIGGAMLAAAAWCIANAPTVIEAEEGET